MKEEEEGDVMRIRDVCVRKTTAHRTKHQAPHYIKHEFKSV